MRAPVPLLASRQRGAAILVAMLVLTLVATLATALQWRQWRVVQQESTARFHMQSDWLLVGALDWARLILREDARARTSTPLDHLSEAWALPLQEVKLSSFLGKQTGAQDSSARQGLEDVFLSGQIRDAQGKFNLTNLVQDGAAHPASMAVLGRLYELLQLPKNELTVWLPRWLEAQAAQAAQMTQVSRQGQSRAAFVLPTRVQDLQWLGVSVQNAKLLADHLTILPKVTGVNVNTASAQVLASVVPSIDLAKAQALVRARHAKPYEKVADFIAGLDISAQGAQAMLSVSSEYFEIKGRLRVGTLATHAHSLVQRSDLDVRTLWRVRLSEHVTEHVSERLN